MACNHFSNFCTWEVTRSQLVRVAPLQQGWQRWPRTSTAAWRSGWPRGEPGRVGTPTVQKLALGNNLPGGWLPRTYQPTASLPAWSSCAHSRRWPGRGAPMVAAMRSAQSLAILSQLWIWLGAKQIFLSFSFSWKFIGRITFAKWCWRTGRLGKPNCSAGKTRNEVAS